MIGIRTFGQRLRSLWTVPSSIAIGLGLTGLVLVYLDTRFDPLTLIAERPFFNEPTAQGMLSIIAGGAMTALSLAYSLVLVVFTLAAANIGPRLLKRFATDPVNQVTAGILGGTFLYCVAVLVFVTDESVPQTAVLGSGVLGVLMVMQLIYFVRQVSRNITIDDEIADIADRLAAALMNRYEKPDDQKEENEFAETLEHQYETSEAGYIGHIDEAAIVKIGRENDCFIRLEKPSGGFLVGGETLFSTSRALDEEASKAVLQAIALEPSRSTDSQIEFSINLLAEIALRALSPGVNDTFTALACVDSISNAFAKIAEAKTSPSITRDDDEEVRLIIPDLSVTHLFSMAFDPLRRASTGNILMSQGLAKAYTRLYIIGSDVIRSQAKHHAALLLEELKRSDHLEIDKRSVISLLIMPLRPDKADSTGQRKN